MAREQNVSESVNFEQISVDIVPPQSSDREVPIVLEVGDLLWVAEVNQSRLRQLKAEIFILKSEKVKNKLVIILLYKPHRHYIRPEYSPYRTHRT